MHRPAETKQAMLGTGQLLVHRKLHKGNLMLLHKMRTMYSKMRAPIMLKSCSYRSKIFEVVAAACSKWLCLTASVSHFWDRIRRPIQYLAIVQMFFFFFSPNFCIFLPIGRFSAPPSCQMLYFAIFLWLSRIPLSGSPQDGCVMAAIIARQFSHVSKAAFPFPLGWWERLSLEAISDSAYMVVIPEKGNRKHRSPGSYLGKKLEALITHGEAFPSSMELSWAKDHWDLVQETDPKAGFGCTFDYS